MEMNPLFFGIVCALIAFVLTFFIPVSPHRVNQTVIGLVIIALILIASFALFDLPLAIEIGIAASAVAIIYRAISRWIREVLWHNVFRYTRRDYWYRRVGRSLLGGRTKRRRD